MFLDPESKFKEHIENVFIKVSETKRLLFKIQKLVLRPPLTTSVNVLLGPALILDVLSKIKNTMLYFINNQSPFKVILN